MMAPDISRILICQISVLLSSDNEYKISSAGHFHCGWLKIANVGTKKEIVPPCTIGNLKKYEL